MKKKRDASRIWRKEKKGKGLNGIYVLYYVRSRRKKKKNYPLIRPTSNEQS